MSVDFLSDTFKKNQSKPAIIWNNQSFNYSWLLNNIPIWKNELSNYGINSEHVVALDGDFSPQSISLLFALIEKKCIIIPLYRSNPSTLKKIFEVAQPQFFITANNNATIKPTSFDNPDSNKLYKILHERKHSGLVLFSSGSSGQPKAAVHDFVPLLEKFKEKRMPLITLNFFLFDHWGGLNTMFHILANGGTLVCTSDRSPENICKLIEKHRIELLPVSPTFLNLLILSESYKKYDLSSLKIISYGSESMPEVILKKIKDIFPKIKIKQTYGLIEVGVLRSTPEKNGTLWFKIGGEGFETRIVDRVLQIKAKSMMLGYLNAPNPFTEDGWFITGDEVEVNGEYIRILGRKSEIINVGGEKVYPAEIENVIQEMEEVAEVSVFGEKNNLLGNIVCAKVRLSKELEKGEFIKLLKKFCKNKLENYKIPVKVTIKNENQFNYRFKKIKINS